MKWFTFLFIINFIIIGLFPAVPKSEILAMLNYESKPQQTIRREGIAVIDVDPASGNFGRTLMDIPLPPDLVNHHIFYNRDVSKAYITALGKSDLYVMDLTKFPYRLMKIGIPECQVGEDVRQTQSCGGFGQCRHWHWCRDAEGQRHWKIPWIGGTAAAWWQIASLISWWYINLRGRY